MWSSTADSSLAIASTSSSVSSRRARRATWSTCSRSIIGGDSRRAAGRRRGAAGVSTAIGAATGRPVESVSSPGVLSRSSRIATQQPDEDRRRRGEAEPGAVRSVACGSAAGPRASPACRGSGRATTISIAIASSVDQRLAVRPSPGSAPAARRRPQTTIASSAEQREQDVGDREDLPGGPGRGRRRCRRCARSSALDRPAGAEPVQLPSQPPPAAGTARRAARRRRRRDPLAHPEPLEVHRGGSLVRPAAPARGGLRARRADVLRSSIAIVIGPTPPGTGVIAAGDLARPPSKSTSPTRPVRRRG